MSEKQKDSGFENPSEKEMLSLIDRNALPKHVAIIMDGNGRWAEHRRLPRIAGHRKGMESVRKTVTLCRELGIKVLTLYAFSKENWGRPKNEVNALMRLLEVYLQKEIATMMKNNIRFTIIGDTELLPHRIQQRLQSVIKKTANNTGLILNIALSYGGRAEILNAVKKLFQDISAGRFSIEGIDEVTFERYLNTAGIPEPDLIIRTSGEMRISNFLLWQSAYSELYFTETLWPDFKRKAMLAALIEYQKRERRFGLIKNKDRSDYGL
ncbi:MAG: isoprenyl transferase [Nitrospirota bacterium]